MATLAEQLVLVFGKTNHQSQHMGVWDPSHILLNLAWNLNHTCFAKVSKHKYVCSWNKLFGVDIDKA